MANCDNGAVSKSADSSASVCGLEEGRSAAAAEALHPSSSHQDSGKAFIGSSKSYLSTQSDSHELQEPCAMCPMAATHARLRRMKYCFPDSQHGTLEGAFSHVARRA